MSRPARAQRRHDALPLRGRTFASSTRALTGGGGGRSTPLVRDRLRGRRLARRARRTAVRELAAGTRAWSWWSSRGTSATTRRRWRASRTRAGGASSSSTSTSRSSRSGWPEFAARAGREAGPTWSTASAPLRKGTLVPAPLGGVFWKLFNALSETRVPENPCTVRLMSRRYVDALLTLPDRNLFLAGSYAWSASGRCRAPVEKGLRRDGLDLHAAAG